MHLLLCPDFEIFATDWQPTLLYVLTPLSRSDRVWTDASVFSCDIQGCIARILSRTQVKIV